MQDSRTINQADDSLNYTKLTFEAYGYRRVGAELRHRGIVVNAKKIRRLMHEHALNPRQRRRFIVTTDSDHNYPIFPDLMKNMKSRRRTSRR